MGLIGNCQYLALIDHHANVNWMCWPRFDSSFLFGGLVDEKNGGRFQIRPETDDFQSTQKYLPNTNILTTEFTTADGAYRVTDFAPRFFSGGRYVRPNMLCRKIEPLTGSPRIRICCSPKLDYGQTIPKASDQGECIVFENGDKPIHLYTDVPFTFVLEQHPMILNKPIYMILTWGSTLEEPTNTTWESYFQQTRAYWEQWVFRTSIGPFYQSQVIRSALTLKMHQFEDTGAIIASATTSLPESPGSGRTWDYRYCWMRDTFYTLRALNGIGHFDELVGYSNFIQNIAITETKGYQPVYAISGDWELTEHITELAGYLGNQPVRVGNQAFEHIQNDVYGQVLVSLLPLYIDDRFAQHGFTSPSLKLIRDILTQIERRMDEPDAGLWEFRNTAMKFAYTYLFHWAGANAALKIANRFKDQAMADRAQIVIQKAKAELEKCYRPHLKAYSQAQEVETMDACLFQLITMGYLDPNSEIARTQIEVLAKRLHVGETGLFFRYKHEDDFGKPEAAFLICGFWYVEALACVGRVTEAISTFEQLLKYSNSLGLFSEDVGPHDGSQWGNFPQTYSHVGLMNAATRIAQKLDKPIFL
jgi:GH15 family glucan-1,4-alpha-glucosidase